MLTRQQFNNRPKIRNLSPKEKERRWKQHQASIMGQRQATRRGYTRNTRLVPRRTKRGMVAELTMSPCAQEYLVAMHSPFTLKRPACVPDLHAVPSKKIRLKTRGTFSTGADGNGYIHVNPWNNCNSSATAGFSLATTATSSSFQPLFSANTGTLFESKIPYSQADFKESGGSPGVLARTVAVGLRIRYIGPELTRSGQVIGLRHPDNLTLVGQTFAQSKSYSTAKVFACKRKWQYCIWRPVRPTEYEFSQNSTWTNESASAHPSIGFAIEGTTGFTGNPGPMPFEFEIIRYVEYIGNIDNITSSHVDLTSMSKIRNSQPTKSATEQPHKSLVKAIDMIEKHAPEVIGGGGVGALLAKHAGQAEGEGILSGIMNSIESGAESVLSTLGSALPSFGEAAETFEAAAPLLLL